MSPGETPSTFDLVLTPHQELFVDFIRWFGNFVVGYLCEISTGDLLSAKTMAGLESEQIMLLVIHASTWIPKHAVKLQDLVSVDRGSHRPMCVVVGSTSVAPLVTQNCDRMSVFTTPTLTADQKIEARRLLQSMVCCSCPAQFSQIPKLQADYLTESSTNLTTKSL